MDARCPALLHRLHHGPERHPVLPQLRATGRRPGASAGLRRGWVSLRPRTRRRRGFGAGRFTGEPPPGGWRLPGAESSLPGSGGRSSGWSSGLLRDLEAEHVLAAAVLSHRCVPDVPWSEALFYAWIIHGFTVVLALPFVGLGLFRPGLPSNFGADTAQMENMMRRDVRLGWASPGRWARCSSTPWWSWRGGHRPNLFAMLFGAAKNGYGATVRALCYAQGPNALRGHPLPRVPRLDLQRGPRTSSASPASRRRAPARRPASCSCPSSSSSAAAGSSPSSSPRPSPGWSAGWPAAAGPSL
jgi:hypothetical protein